MSHLHHKVSALVDGELQGSARRRALAHVRRCDGCRRELEAVLALKQRLAGLQSSAEPSADLFTTLGSVTGPAQAPTTPQSRVALVGRRLLVGAGSVSMAVLSLAYVVGAPDEAATTSVAPPIEEFSAEFAARTGAEALADPAVGALSGDRRLVRVGQGPARDGGDRLERGRPLSAVVGAPLVTGDEPRAVRQLTRAVKAPSRFAYTGTRKISTYDEDGQGSVTVTIRHSPDQGTSFRVAGGGDATGATFLAQDETADTSAVSDEAVDLLVEAYDVSVMGAGQVVGRDATIVATSQDGVLRARFWIDDDTGLLLRREIYLDGSIVRASTFVSLGVARHGFLAHLPPELIKPFATVVSMEAAPSLNDAGWTCPSSIGGGLSLTVLDRPETGGDVMHAEYSDGLSNVSVFESPGTLDASDLQGFEVEHLGGSDVYVRYGLPTVAVWESRGSTVYTVVTDAPHETAADVVMGLPHEPPAESGVTARVGAGLDTIASFLNPVG